LAFSGCSGFTSVTNLNPVPQGIYNNVFRNINALTLSVIAGSIAAYQAANVWKDFGNIVAIP
jgi:hypothetical protein